MNGMGRAGVVLGIALLLGSVSGWAKGNNDYDGPCGYGTGHACPANSPEIDPGMGAAALLLIGGGVMVLRGRRKA